MVQTPSESETFFGLDISGIKKSFFKVRRKISKRYLLIEFGVNSVTYCESRVNREQVYFSKFNRIPIENTAIERGTPTNADAMGAFLSQIIEEEQIWAHRVAITLPPQAALSKIIYLPDHLNYQEALDYISNPSTSGFQFPISIENTDFDLIPLKLIPKNNKNKTKAYFLNSVPKKLIDNVIKTLFNANLELHSLDISYLSLERLALSTNKKIKNNQVFILLEFSLECTHFTIISTFGPIYVSTLAAIKAFDVQENYEGEDSIEENTINSKEYLSISELDLKVLLAEVNSEIDQFNKNYDLEVSKILLSGINSSHPGIKDLIQKFFNIETNILRGLSSESIGDISLAKPIVMQDLNRLIGLGLSMIQTEKNISDENKNASSEIEIKSSYGKVIKKDINNNKKRKTESNIIENQTKFEVSKLENESFEKFLKNNSLNNKQQVSFDKKPVSEFVNNNNKENNSIIFSEDNFNENSKVSKNEIVHQKIIHDGHQLDSEKESLELNNINSKNESINNIKSNSTSENISYDESLIIKNDNNNELLDFESSLNKSPLTLDNKFETNKTNNNSKNLNLNDENFDLNNLKSKKETINNQINKYKPKKNNLEDETDFKMPEI